MRAIFPHVGVLLVAMAAAAAEPPPSPGVGYAVLVGVCAYEHAGLPPLNYAENDVEQLAKELDRPGSPFHQRVRLLTTARGKSNPADQPTAANVKAALAKVLANRTRQETVLVALAGHGVQLLVPDPAGQEDERSYGYFCPSDAQLSGVNFRTGQAEKLVLLPDLLQKLGDCGAGSKLLLMDACRNQLRLKQRSLVIRHDMVPNGVAALFSCKPGEVSYEAERLKHGVFFHFLLDGLRGGAKNRRGEVTWAQLADYVTEKVTEDAETLIGAKVVQTPHLIANLAGRSPVLAGPGSEAERLYRQGLELYRGGGGPVDQREDVRLFRRAAEQGHGVAQLALAVCLTREAVDRGGANPAAAGWAQKGLAVTRARAAAGDPDAQVWLGGAYTHGLGVAKDDGQAVGWYRKAADQGFAAGQNDLGRCYSDGRGVAQDEAAAVGWYRQAAGRGHGEAQCHLGYRYENGLGVEKDAKEAVAWYRKAADQGFAYAQSALGWCYQLGLGVEKDEKEAVAWYRKAAARDQPRALHQLGWCYQEGLGVKADAAEAVRWYRRGAAQGFTTSLHNLGWCYQEGLGVKKDAKEAVAWYRKAAAQNDSLSQYRLGWCYQEGLGIERDLAKALEWYRKGAAQGNGLSLHQLGWFYQNGIEVEKDEKEAVAWYLKAAERQVSTSFYNLGWCYRYGVGVEKDLNEARRWYQKAAARGYDDARQQLKELE